MRGGADEDVSEVEWSNGGKIMLYFEKDLISLARQIIYAKETTDDVKAFNDLYEIERDLSFYAKTGRYNSIYLRSLDKRLRHDYQIIDIIDRLPSNGESVQNSYDAKNLPSEIRNIEIDMYGIFTSVLMKKGIIKDVKQVLRDNAM